MHRLVYENVTALEDMAAPDHFHGGELLDEKYEYIPVIWGPSYASGASVAGRLGLSRSSNARSPFASREEAYRRRDESRLARRMFYERYLAGEEA